MLGLSRVTVRQRLARLRAGGVIRRFTVELSEPVEEAEIRAVSLIELSGARAEAIRRALGRLEEVRAVYSTNGKWGLVAETRSRTLAEFDRLLTRIGRIEGIVQVETCLLLSRVI